MSEERLNERRNWKAQTFPYDYFIPDESAECQYCLTDKQAEILRGIVEPLAWQTRWWSDTDTEIGRDLIEAFRDDLIRRLMMGCCGDEIPAQYRYTDDGVLQRSTDAGVTWTDAPEFDPRVYSPQFPPMSGADGNDKKCIAATGAAALIKEQLGDQLTDDMGRYTLNQLITDWVRTTIESSDPFQVLVTVISNQIFALVIATLRPALTAGVYEQLKCILFCNMADDATFNTAQWAQVRSDITDQISGIAGVFLEHLVYLLGIGGLTNLVRAGAATSGDCSSCECEPCEGCDTFAWTIRLEESGITGTIVAETRLCNFIELHSTGFNPADGRYYHQLISDSDDSGCVVGAITTTGSIVDLYIAYDAPGEARGTFAHETTFTAIVGIAVVGIFVRTINYSTITLTT